MAKHTATKSSSIKARRQKIQAKLLSSYYGHPIKDLKLICITGSTGKVTVAHYLQEIFRAANLKSAILASEQGIKTSILHKFFNSAWQANNEYVIVTAPATALKNNVFYNLPVHLAALTNFIPSTLKDLSPTDYLQAKSTLFNMHPAIVVLNRDDAHYSDFSEFKGNSDTISYGADRSAYIRIDYSKLYKKGAEANLIIGTKSLNVATFLTGEPVISYMACATAIATALKIPHTAITDGIANFNPDSSDTT